MSTDLKFKRLLILGATAFICNIIKVAKSMGVYTIVVDPIPDSPAKVYADKSYNCNTLDEAGLLDIAKNERIDGIMTGYSDLNLAICRKLCTILGLPFYATMEQIEITKDKIKFKEMCRKFGVPVVPEYSLNEPIDKIIYPVVTKPSDSFSGKGIRICNNEKELMIGVEYALEFSKSKTYLIEKYMDSRSVKCVNIDYLIKDGEIFLSAVGNKYVNNEQGNLTPLTAAVLYPSEYLEEYIRTTDKNVRKMFHSLGIKNGTIFIESFYDKDGFYFYEMGFRLGGGQSSIILNEISSVDYVQMMINHSLTGSMGNDDMFKRIDPFFSKVGCGLVILMKDGTIGNIYGLDEIRKMLDVINITQFFNKNDNVTPKLKGTLGQTFARIHIVSEDMANFRKTLEQITQKLKVEDIHGNNMLLRIINQNLHKDIYQGVVISSFAY